MCRGLTHLGAACATASSAAAGGSAHAGGPLSLAAAATGLAGWRLAAAHPNACIALSHGTLRFTHAHVHTLPGGCGCRHPLQLLPDGPRRRGVAHHGGCGAGRHLVRTLCLLCACIHPLLPLPCLSERPAGAAPSGRGNGCCRPPACLVCLVCRFFLKPFHWSVWLTWLVLTRRPPTPAAAAACRLLLPPVTCCCLPPRADAPLHTAGCLASSSTCLFNAPLLPIHPRPAAACPAACPTACTSLLCPAPALPRLQW